MAGTTHYRYIFKADSGETWKVEILDNTYVGTTFTTVYPDSSGFIMSWEDAGEDVYKPILASEFSAGLFRDANIRALLDKIIEGPECRFSILIYKLISAVYTRFWQGFLLQDSLMKPDAADNTDLITIKGNDGFGLLKNVDYVYADIDNLTRFAYNDWMYKIGLSLPLTTISPDDALFAFASVWYEAQQSSSVIPTPQLADPIGNTYISEAAFIEVDDYGVIKTKSLYDILNALLSLHNLQMSQWNGKYLIIQQNTYAQAQTRAWYYSNDGSYIDTEIIDLQATMPDRFTAGQFNYILPAKKVTTEYEYREGIYDNNLLPNNVNEATNYTLGLSVQNSDIRITGKIETIYNGSGGTLAQIQAIYKLVIKNGTKYLNQNASGEQEWTTSSGNYVPIYTRNFKSDYAGDQRIITDVAITATLPEEGETITFSYTFYRLENYGEGTAWSDVGCTYTISHDDIEGSFIARVDSGEPMQGKALYESTASNGARSDIELENIYLGDGINKYSAGCVFVRTGALAIVQSENWSIYSEIGSFAESINTLRCRERLALQNNTIQTYMGSFKGEPNIHKGFVWGGLYWAWMGVTWDCSNDRYSGMLMAITLDRADTAVSTPVIATDDTSSGSSIGGGSNTVADSHNRLHNIFNTSDHSGTGGTAKATIVDADSVVIIDSEDGSKVKRSLWSTIKGAMQTYLEPIWQALTWKISIDTGTPVEIGMSTATTGYTSLKLKSGTNVTITEASGIDDSLEVTISAATTAPIGMIIFTYTV